MISFDSYCKINDGLNLTWSDLNVSQRQQTLLSTFLLQKTHDKIILKNQSGKVLSGELVGLLGPSGCGKTDLLNTLSFRKVNNLQANGSIKINGVQINRQRMHSLSAYVQKEDLFIGTMTVKEHLMFHAMLRSNPKMKTYEKADRVEQLIHELVLYKCQDSIIGTSGKGIKPGERKRLSIATEILNNPMILFCDEPTSGLDASMAYTVVECLKKIAKSGKSVLCTIHQPSSETYLMFDSIYVLYDGSLALAGSNTAIINFLSTLNMRLPANYNPADFIMNSLSTKSNSVVQDSFRSNYIVYSYQHSKLYELHLHSVMRTSTQTDHSNGVFNYYIDYKKFPPICMFIEILYILKRTATNFVRDRGLLVLRVLMNIIFSILIGVAFFDQKQNKIHYVVINRVLFIAVTCVSVINVIPSILLYSYELKLVRNEHESKVYSLMSYFIANFLFEIPIYALLTFVFNFGFYWLVGLNDHIGSFFVSFTWLFIVSLIALGFGQMLSALTSTPFRAILLLVPTLSYQLLANEFFLSLFDSPLDWLKYVSWIFYSFNLLLINQWSSIGLISSTNSVQISGHDVLQMLEVKTHATWLYILGLFSLLFLWRFISFFVTYLKIRFH